MNELVQILKNTRQHLMTGVSHMIPFVVSGGILLAVSVMLYGKGAVPDAVADPNLKKLFDIGVAGLTLMVPFLAAYIGYSIAERSALVSIAERSALAPCAIGAWVGNSFGAGFFGAGFFGALIAGIIGGIVVHYLKKIPVHKVLRSVMPLGNANLHHSNRRHTDYRWRTTDYRWRHDVGAGRAGGGVDQQPDPVASGDAAGQHCYAGGDHGSDAGVRYGRPG